MFLLIILRRFSLWTILQRQEQKKYKRKILLLPAVHMRNSTMGNWKKQDARMLYHKALCYCPGICDDTRKNIYNIYDFKTGSIKTGCLHESWQTSGSMKVVRMAFNLYCNGTPSVFDYENEEEQADECRKYTVEDLFCCIYAPYFWQAVQIRYPEYAVYNKNRMPCREGKVNVKNQADGD